MANKKKVTAKKVVNNPSKKVASKDVKKVMKPTPSTKAKKVTAKNSVAVKKPVKQNVTHKFEEEKQPENNKVVIDTENDINVYVQKNKKYIRSVIDLRKNGFVNVFNIRKEIVKINCDTSIDPNEKSKLLIQKNNEIKEAYKQAIKSQKAISKIVDDAIENKFFDIKVCFSYEQIKYKNYINELENLRADGENKLIALKSEIQDIRLNKQIDKKTRLELINANKEEIKKAKNVANKNKVQVKALLSEAMLMSKLDFKEYFKIVKASGKVNNAEAKKIYIKMIKNLKSEHKATLNSIKNSPDDKKIKNVNLKAENIAYSSKVNEAKTLLNEQRDSTKAERHNAFLNSYNYSSKINNDKHSFCEWFKFKYENYIANFNFINWIIKNALYVVILVVFVALVIMTNGGLLYGESLLGALVQIAPKIFFALGVASLILLGGTDLSIGRLTGVGVSFTLMILSNDIYKDINGNAWWLFTTIPGAVKVIIAIFVSVLLCTIFTSFAGFFTAKFKMHPFISTLAVQLISYGFFQIFWSATSSFTPDSSIIEALRGPQSFLLVIYAIIAIIVVWFIWNKTRFGKHLYAVGGNQEAATVSGINPFTITMLAFVMAGILYGLGGFVQAVQTGTGNFNSGYGTETDAIAACVIGGISFSGGVGKVGGAVLGAIILGFLTYAFAYIGVNSNLQLLIKGIIILIAVALDCVKYLKKK